MRWGGRGSNPRPADYEKHAQSQHTLELHCRLAWMPRTHTRHWEFPGCRSTPRSTPRSLPEASRLLPVSFQRWEWFRRTPDLPYGGQVGCQRRRRRGHDPSSVCSRTSAPCSAGTAQISLWTAPLTSGHRGPIPFDSGSGRHTHFECRATPGEEPTDDEHDELARPAAYKKHGPEHWVCYLHRCHTKVSPLHQKLWEFQAIRSTTRSTLLNSVPLGSRGRVCRLLVQQSEPCEAVAAVHPTLSVRDHAAQDLCQVCRRSKTR